MNETHNSEILQIIESVAKEKGLPKETLIIAMEQAVRAAASKKYGSQENIRAEISRKTGEIKIYKVLTVVEKLSEENYLQEITLDSALKRKLGCKIGDEMYEALPPIDLGRVAAQIAKHVIVQQVNDADREKQYNDFQGRQGEVLSGIVKRLEFGNIIVDLGRTEGVIKKDQLIKNESYKINDHIKAYVQAVKRDSKDAQVFLSRTDDQMLAKLFAMEVPEIYDGAIKIQAIARDPGSKSKIAVFASDSSVDLLGSCVGIKGNRVRAVTAELNGEKIDIVAWDRDLKQFVKNAMTPLTPRDILDTVFNKHTKKIEVIVPDDKLSIAIGRQGQNVKLASKLVGIPIDIMTSNQQIQKRNEKCAAVTELFIEKLDVDYQIAELLFEHNLHTIADIANSDIIFLSSIKGFSNELAQELQKRAEAHNKIVNEKIVNKLESLGVEQELLNILVPKLQPEEILALAQYGVKAIEDLAELKIKEFKDAIPTSNMLYNEIKDLIDYAILKTKNVNIQN